MDVFAGILLGSLFFLPFIIGGMWAAYDVDRPLTDEELRVNYERRKAEKLATRDAYRDVWLDARFPEDGEPDFAALDNWKHF